MEGGAHDSAHVTCGPIVPFKKCAVFLECALQVLHTASQGQWQLLLLPTPAFTAVGQWEAGSDGISSVGHRQEQLALGTQVLVATIHPADGWDLRKKHAHSVLLFCVKGSLQSTQCHMILSVYLPELRGSGPCWLSPALAILVRAALSVPIFHFIGILLTSPILPSPPRLNLQLCNLRGSMASEGREL